MAKSLRDLLYDCEMLRSDLDDARLFHAAQCVSIVMDAIRNREAYDSAEGAELEEGAS